jgi:hypothetical protein
MLALSRNCWDNGPCLNRSSASAAFILTVTVLVGLTDLVRCSAGGWCRERPRNRTVTNTSDTGAGSLRVAIALAASGDTITFAPDVRGTIVLTSGELRIEKHLTIAVPARPC